MCYYVASKLSRKEIYSIGQEFKQEWEEEENESFHVVSGFGHPRLPVLTAEGNFKLLRWGMIPSWVKDWETGSKLRTQTLNAISDTIENKSPTSQTSSGIVNAITAFPSSAKLKREAYSQ